MRKSIRSASVSLAHRYWNFAWDRAQNERAYGDFASPEGVGSNLRVELAADHEPDLEPGLRALKRLLDHRALFRDVPEFTNGPSTLETITRFANHHLESTGGGGHRRVTIHEDDARWCRIDDGDRERVLVGERVWNLTVVTRGAIDPASGLVVPRGEVAAAVARIAPHFANPARTDEATWALDLFRALKTALGDVAELVELDIALAAGRTLKVNPGPASSNQGDSFVDQIVD